MDTTDPKTDSTGVEQAMAYGRVYEIGGRRSAADPIHYRGVIWLPNGDCPLWRCPFDDISTDPEVAFKRMVRAAEQLKRRPIALYRHGAKSVTYTVA